MSQLAFALMQQGRQLIRLHGLCLCYSIANGSIRKSELRKGVSERVVDC